MEQVGPYTVHEQLGSGATGVVRRAVDGRTGREVALKLLAVVDDERARRRFVLEARALARLLHPGIVVLFDAGEERGRPWLALELVRGRSLEARLQAQGPLAPRDAAALGLSLARALAHAHGAGVLHRDLKPGNVLLPEDGGPPKLTDFGLAGFTSLELSQRLTRSGLIQGTPGYWSPEQASGRVAELGPATDVYGLGGVLYAALTGRPPFQGESLPEVLLATVRDRPAAPGKDRALDAIVMRCLEKAPGDRPPSVAAVAAELEAWLSPPAPSPPALPRAGARRLALAGAVLVALFVVSVVAGRAARALHEPAPATGPPPPATPPRDAASVAVAPPAPAPAAPPAPARAPPGPASTPPSVAPRLAPDDEVRPLLEAVPAAFPLRPTARESDALLAARSLLAGDGQAVARAYPDDARAVALGAIAALLHDPRADEVALRREAARAALGLRPALDGRLIDRVARLCLGLGFERAAADLLEGSHLAGDSAGNGVAYTLAYIYVKAAPPVQDLARAEELVGGLLRDRAVEVGRARNRERPTASELRQVVVELRLFDGDLAGAAALLREAAAATRWTQLQEEHLQRAAALERGEHDRRWYDVPGRRLTPLAVATPFMAELARAAALADQLQDREVAGELMAWAQAASGPGGARPDEVALALVAAARLLARVGEAADARVTLEGALRAAVAPDVRALALRALARLLLDVDASRAEALAREAALAPAEAWLTRGEVADAWVLVGEARRRRGDRPGALEAAARAAAEQPHDARGVAALRR